MTTATVAAILTVLGYSIYDTIIILDRIRENIPLMRRASFRTIANVSLWETIPRSLATTFITLLPIAALYFFGGETLKDFAFALLVGIGSGAYSSIFVAAPLLAVLQGARARVRAAEGRRRLRRHLGRPLLEEAEELAAAEPRPELVPAAAPGDPDLDGDGDHRTSGPPRPMRRSASGAGSAGGRAPMADPATTAPSRSASSSRSSAPSCARGPRGSATCRRRRATGSPASSGS